MTGALFSLPSGLIINSLLPKNTSPLDSINSCSLPFEKKEASRPNPKPASLVPKPFTVTLKLPEALRLTALSNCPKDVSDRRQKIVIIYRLLTV